MLRVATWFGILSLLALLACGGTQGSSSQGASNNPFGPTSTFAGLSVGQADLKADFDNRTVLDFPVPHDFISTPNGVFKSMMPQALATLSNHGVYTIKSTVRFELVFPTSQPDFTAVDQELTAIQSAGMHAIALLQGTPSWLVPANSPCTANGHYWANSLPSDYAAWGKLAAAYVAHVDSKFPGLVEYFEIWNEPDLEGFTCNLTNYTTTARVAEYANFYAAAAAAMKEQAAADGSAIKVGGPALSNGWVTTALLPNFLGNPQVAPLVDFVSYHYYPAPKGYTNWDDPTSGLFAQSIQGDSGFAGFYRTISTQTSHGLQPNASSTPIIITEYNDNPQYGVNCCRNSPTYSPLFNTVAVVDLLNTIYSGIPRVPSTVGYYRALDNSSFCLLATAGTDCKYSGGPLTAFPQLITFQLISSPQYLGLSDHAFMTPKAVLTSDDTIRASAFFTSGGDSLLIVNPSANPKNGLVVGFSNPGITPSGATVFLLNQQNPNITATHPELSQTQNGYEVSVDVPAYSVVGIQLK